MLCSIAVRRVIQPNESGLAYGLRIGSKHVLGNAGNSGSEERTFTSVSALLEQLQALRVPDDLKKEASTCMQSEASSKRFVTIGSAVQIPFDVIQEQGFDLFD